jgi:transmembrane sensor
MLLGRSECRRDMVSVSCRGRDVEPGSKGAVLTLSNGKQIVLDSMGSGVIAVQGNVQVVSRNGKLVYNGEGGTPGTVQYNTVVTPRARQYQLVLSDGTNVWLNAASSIRYPAVFDPNMRVVEITGEAYFEVAQLYVSNAGTNKDPGAKVPFIVKIKAEGEEQGQVEVLGTHFNINSYDDESAVKTTLLEGRVRIKNAGNELLLHPGNQSQLNRNGVIRVVGNADIEATIAWKNGLFSFDKTDIKTVMNQLARWYDIEVSYENGNVPNESFWGDIQRSVKLSTILKAFEKTGVRFSIDGKKVTVLK